MPAWKAELNAKLAAHRQRRPSSALAEAAGSPRPASSQSSDGAARAALVAARVAERYANAPSYSEFLAASAAAAASAAETAAFAARQAQDAAEAFARLSAGARQPEDHQDHNSGPQIVYPSEPEMGRSAAAGDRPTTVEHPEPLPARGVLPPRPVASSAGLFANGFVDAIAEATVPAAVSLPAKLIAFPRELVAPRKSRPRIAEGPLVESSLFDDTDGAALRIFEVEGNRMGSETGRDTWETSAAFLPRAESDAQSNSREPAQRNEPGVCEEVHASRESYSGSTQDARSYNDPVHGAPGWQSIRLGEHPFSPSADGVEAGRSLPDTEDRRSELSEAHVLHTASLGDRTMAALVDAALVTGAFALFILVFALCTAHPPLDRTAFCCAALLFAGLFLFYEWLFLSYGGGTPGMRYARIALCTFDDENPTRQVSRRRVLASVLSALPLGLGFLWAIFDQDSLGWHDRMTRSYQRSYR